MTNHAKLWYYFVAARLMPTVTNSEVRKKRAFLTYAIMKGIKVDVGRIIYREIRGSLTSQQSQTSLGFPALILSLATAAGIRVDSTASSRINVRQIICLRAFGEERPVQAQRAQRQPSPVDSESTADADDDDEDEAGGGRDGETSQGQTFAGRGFGVRMDAMEGRLDALTQRFEALDTRVTARFDASDARMTKM